MLQLLKVICCKDHWDQCPRNNLEQEAMKDKPYASLVGSLMYAFRSALDLIFPVLLVRLVYSKQTQVMLTGLQGKRFEILTRHSRSPFILQKS